MMRTLPATLCVIALVGAAQAAFADVVPPPMASQSIVVFRGARTESVWFEQIGDAQNVLARRDGVAALVDDTLWIADEQHSLGLLADCDDPEDDADLGSYLDRLFDAHIAVVSTPTFHTFDEAYSFGPFDDQRVGTRTLDFGSLRGDLLVYGIANNIVFARECVEQYSCGAAHGSVDCRFAAYDLSTRQRRPLSDFIAADAQTAAIEVVAAAPSAEMAACAIEADDPASWSVVAVEPIYTEGDALLYALVTTDSAYACSTGCWGSYHTCAWQRVGDWEIEPIRLSIPLQNDDMAVGITTFDPDRVPSSLRPDILRWFALGALR